jgi:hypothetical protein
MDPLRVFVADKEDTSLSSVLAEDHSVPARCATVGRASDGRTDARTGQAGSSRIDAKEPSSQVKWMPIPVSR